MADGMMVLQQLVEIIDVIVKLLSCRCATWWHENMQDMSRYSMTAQFTPQQIHPCHYVLP